MKLFHFLIVFIYVLSYVHLSYVHTINIWKFDFCTYIAFVYTLNFAFFGNESRRPVRTGCCLHEQTYLCRLACQAFCDRLFRPGSVTLIVFVTPPLILY